MRRDDLVMAGGGEGFGQVAPTRYGRADPAARQLGTEGLDFAAGREQTMRLERGGGPAIVFGLGGNKDRGGAMVLGPGRGAGDELGADEFEIDIAAGQLDGKWVLSEDSALVGGGAHLLESSERRVLCLSRRVLGRGGLLVGAPHEVHEFSSAGGRLIKVVAGGQCCSPGTSKRLVWRLGRAEEPCATRSFEGFGAFGGAAPRGARPWMQLGTR